MSEIQEPTNSLLALDSLRIVSMNLAGCKPSAEAPASWNETTVARAVQQELLQSNPDFLALQECRDKDEMWVETLFEGYKVIGVGTSHAGYVMLLVRDSLAAHTTPVSLPGDLPAVMAQIQFSSHNNDDRVVLNVASCHLAPFAGGARRRSSQIQMLLEVSGSKPLVIAGDTNMRQEENAVMEGMPFNLRDVWKEAGEDPATMFTWDTENHIEEGGFFNRYYGETTREYRTRYDRIYVSTPEAKNDGKGLEISVQFFGLVANRPVNPFTKTHFLSDHFGIKCGLKLE